MILLPSDGLLPLHLPNSVKGKHRTYLHSTGILTSFPNVGYSELPQTLGSTNPQLTNVAEEPLLYAVLRILILILLLLTP